jgi:hypothetical protein
MSSGGDNRDEGDERPSPNERPRIRYNNASPPLSVQRLLRQDVQAYLQETQQAQPADPMWSPRRPGTGRRPGQPAQPRPTLNLPRFQPSPVVHLSNSHKTDANSRGTAFCCQDVPFYHRDTAVHSPFCTESPRRAEKAVLHSLQKQCPGQRRVHLPSGYATYTPPAPDS